MLALIGGSGFTNDDVIENRREIVVDTPWGKPSAPLIEGTLKGTPILFLRRHGVKHEFAPHHVPSRANLWALKDMGVSGVIAVGTVGGIASDMGPGRIAVPNQLIDYTWGREVTYYDDFAKYGMKHVIRRGPLIERSVNNSLMRRSVWGQIFVVKGFMPVRRAQD